MKLVQNGCGGQYKNKYNFINLCCHKKDFNTQAEWNFFATSHGKSASDGIGGTVKRLTRKTSLQRPVSNQILSLEAMYSFCVENISGAQFIKVLDQDVIDHEKTLSSRFELAQTIPGPQNFHRFVPVTESTLKAFKISNQKDDPKLNVTDNAIDANELLEAN